MSSIIRVQPKQPVRSDSYVSVLNAAKELKRRRKKKKKKKRKREAKRSKDN